MRKLTTLLGLLALGTIAISWQEAKPAAAAKNVDAAIIAAQKPSYPLDTCVISGKKLGSKGDPIDVVHEGRLVRFCCKGCPKAFEKDPQKAFKKIDAAVIAQQVPIYPFETCLVSKEPLDAMGKPLDHVDGTRLVRFCCKGCVKQYKKNPAKFMAQIDEALIEKQLASYPLETCLVSGEALGSMGDPINELHGTRLVRFCCKSCPKTFKKNPEKYLAKLDAAQKDAKKKKTAEKG